MAANILNKIDSWIRFGEKLKCKIVNHRKKIVRNQLTMGGKIYNEIDEETADSNIGN